MRRVAPWAFVFAIACGPPPSPNDPDPPPPSGLDAGLPIDAVTYVGPIRYELRLTGDAFDPRSNLTVTIADGGGGYGCNKSYGPPMPCPPPPPPVEETFSLPPPPPGEALAITSELVAAGRPVRLSVTAPAGENCNQVYGTTLVVAAPVTTVALALAVSHVYCAR